MPFGLKIAPSVFQRAMLRIYSPLRETALIYIDDILLFSPTAEEHMSLLQQFYSITKQYGIMISEKKMLIGQTNIEFLGMRIDKGCFQPQPHIAQELLRFPDSDFTKKEVQQFLGIINYLGSFIKDVSRVTHPLSKMLKKNAPLWGSRQTQAVKDIKAMAQDVPPLHIPVSDGQIILQTDASDKYWGAVLLQEKDGHRTICSYKSGRFTDAEMHYHSTYKEILAVKRAIEKLEFYVAAKHFHIEMDMSSFPKMLQFKQKTIPPAQLLRWADWFSKYSFTVKHIKGKDNFLPDLLSRKPLKELQMFYKFLDPYAYFHHTQKILNTEQQEHSSQSFQNSQNNNIFTITKMEDGLYDFTNKKPFDARGPSTHVNRMAKKRIFHYQQVLIQRYGLNGPIQPMGVHPDFPFAHLFTIKDVMDFPQSALCFLWYLTTLYTIGISLDVNAIYKLMSSSPTNNLAQFLLLFLPRTAWIRTCFNQYSRYFAGIKEGEMLTTRDSKWNPHSISFFSKKVMPKARDTAHIQNLSEWSAHADFQSCLTNLMTQSTAYMTDFQKFQERAFNLNNTDQKFIILQPENLTESWRFYPQSYCEELDESYNLFINSPNFVNSIASSSSSIPQHEFRTRFNPPEINYDQDYLRHLQHEREQILKAQQDNSSLFQDSQMEETPDEDYTARLIQEYEEKRGKGLYKTPLQREKERRGYASNTTDSEIGSDDSDYEIMNRSPSHEPIIKD